MEKGYMISDAARLVEVENHVLRYWEEELELPIPRNEMGHRFYRESDIKLLRSVKDLKEQGFQLRAIKKLLPDLGRLEHMDAQDIYRLREELNGQVFQETMERTMDNSKASVTSLNQARYEKRQKTWQERSFELEQSRAKPATQLQEAQRKASLERLHQFEAMLQQMIRGTMEEFSRESEERICEEVSTRLQKEMNYLLLRKEELQEKQIDLLQEILAQVKQEESTEEEDTQMPEAAGSVTPQDETSDGDGEQDEMMEPDGGDELQDVAVTAEEMAETKLKKRMRLRKEKKRKKLFAKSV